MAKHQDALVAMPPAEEPGAGGTAEGSSGGQEAAPDPQPRAGLKQLLANKAKERRETAAEMAEAKKRKEQHQGTKRAAETSVEEAADESKAEGEVIGGLPTLHEAELLAANPDDGLLEEQSAFDERTGEALPLDKVKRARVRELDKMLERNIKKDISWVETQTDPRREQVAESPAPERRAGTSTTPSRSSAKTVQETTPDAHTVEGLRPRGRREEINARREDDQRRMEELPRMQLEERVFATIRGGRYRKDTCGDLRKARMANPQGIV